MIYCEKMHKRGIAAISTVLGAGGILLIGKGAIALKEFIICLDHSSQIVVIGMVLLFIFMFSVFVVKPITLTLIRWIIFKKIHDKELSESKKAYTLPTQNKMRSISEALFSELDEIDKDSRDDFEKINRIADYQERRLKGH